MTVYRDLADVPSGRYSVIYADPPWEYTYWRKSGSNGRAAANHYDVAPPQDISRMDVGRIAAKDCYLFMWVTGPMLPQALDVIGGWGFTYSTFGFIWEKVNADGSPYVGMGYTVRSNAEIVALGYTGDIAPIILSNGDVCLLTRKGQPPVVSKKQNQIVRAPVGRHSQKPKEVAARIASLAGPGPKIELFARGPPIHGWDAMGWEADGRATTIDAHLNGEGGGD